MADLPSSRPARARVLDELGLPKSLPAGSRDFPPLFGDGPDALLLGLGPEPAGLPELLSLRGRVRYVESPEFAEQMGADWRAAIPAGFEAAAPEEVPALALSSRVILYRPGPRLFPGFWGPLLARLHLARLNVPPAPEAETVWLPGGAGDLLRPELAEAFATLGWRAEITPPDDLSARLARGECPALCLCVNFRGIDALGEAAHLLRAAGAHVAAWCVDNPLHLLSGLRARFWTDLPLFVTDDWFLDPLRELGATRVFHLPLAARASDVADAAKIPAPESADLIDLAGRLVFAGRSAFPDKDGFFAGCSVPDNARVEASRLLADGGRADFGWWLARLGVTRLWPGGAVRRAGYCAEETGRAWRAACLTRAHADLAGALTVFGDAGWRELLPPGADLRPPVDYHATLPGVCATAGACLNCTSPLLPHGLTQRHFDVWAWGGLLVTDATPGLALFPRALTQPVTFARPEDIAPLTRGLMRDGAADLKREWRAEIARAHTYVHRARTILEAVGLA